MPSRGVIGDWVLANKDADAKGLPHLEPPKAYARWVDYAPDCKAPGCVYRVSYGLDACEIHAAPSTGAAALTMSAPLEPSPADSGSDGIADRPETDSTE